MTTPPTPRRSPGRPPLDAPRSAHVAVRLTTPERDAIAAAAAARGVSVTDFVRDAALRAARRVKA